MSELVQCCDDFFVCSRGQSEVSQHIVRMRVGSALDNDELWLVCSDQRWNDLPETREVGIVPGSWEYWDVDLEAFRVFFSRLECESRARKQVPSVLM